MLGDVQILIKLYFETKATKGATKATKGVTKAAKGVTKAHWAIS